MRLILPHVCLSLSSLLVWYLRTYLQKDRERATYGLKEAGIAKAFIGALGLDRHSRDATRLMKWKQPTADNVTPFRHTRQAHNISSLNALFLIENGW